jgi:hypothetical protein
VTDDDEVRRVMERIREQLDWRGPTGKVLGHVVLSRADAEILMRAYQQDEGS